MARCIFDKKANMKGYRRCEITGQIKGGRCYNGSLKKHCKHFQMSLFNRFLYWLGSKF